ncbi:MAG: LysR family transcriptional regulator [Hyphomonadaceae bacterium]
MSDIRLTKLRRLDLTTLLVFAALMRLRKATAAAGQLGLTPPGVSHALKRLREVFDDELFLRRPHGLEPTAFAVMLEPRVRRAIEELHAAFSAPVEFDAASAKAVVRIGAFDYELSTLLPPLVGAIADRAPGVRIVTRAIGREQALGALAEGDLDLAIGYFWSASSTILLKQLYSESYAVVARTKDPIARKPLTLARYCAASHILVSPSGELTGIVDTTLRQLGRERRVISATPLFLPALALVRATGALATVPRRFAERFARSFGLTVLKLPFAVREFPVSVARHARNARSPMHDWLEDALTDTV